MIDGPNEYEGVSWVPLRQAFSVTIPNGWQRPRLIGYFPDRETAVLARKNAEIRLGGKKHAEAKAA
jgi:hypothetical protein